MSRQHWELIKTNSLVQLFGYGVFTPYGRRRRSTAKVLRPTQASRFAAREGHHIAAPQVIASGSVAGWVVAPRSGGDAAPGIRGAGSFRFIREVWPFEAIWEGFQVYGLREGFDDGLGALRSKAGLAGAESGPSRPGLPQRYRGLFLRKRLSPGYFCCLATR